jgi:hypothetical protein
MAKFLWLCTEIETANKCEKDGYTIVSFTSSTT